MKTVIKGKNIKKVYSVKSHIKKITDKNGNKIKVYTAKPELCVDKKVDSWSDICSFEGKMQYDSYYRSYPLWGSYDHTIHINENESVRIDSVIFRADLNEQHAFTDKVISETDVNKEEAETEYQTHLKAFNKMMIESNEKMLSYCKIHNLNIENTDALELFDLVYPKEFSYCIENGKIVVNKHIEISAVGTSAVAYGAHCHTISALSSTCNPLVVDCASNDATVSIKW